MSSFSQSFSETCEEEYNSQNVTVQAEYQNKIIGYAGTCLENLLMRTKTATSCIGQIGLKLQIAAHYLVSFISKIVWIVMGTVLTKNISMEAQ